MEITKEMIAGFRVKADRPNSMESDVVKLLTACGGDVAMAVSLIQEHEKGV